MIGNRIKVSAAATDRLKHLKGRTGLTPNILCRFGLCLSLGEEAAFEPQHFEEDGLEFNRYTLLGELDIHLVGLVKEWCVGAGIDLEKEGARYLCAHLNRGVILLFARVRSIPELAQMVLSATAAG